MNDMLTFSELPHLATETQYQIQKKYKKKKYRGATTHSRNPPRPSPYSSETYGKEKRLRFIEAPTRSQKLVLKELKFKSTKRTVSGY